MRIETSGLISIRLPLTDESSVSFPPWSEGFIILVIDPWFETLSSRGRHRREEEKARWRKTSHLAMELLPPLQAPSQTWLGA